MPKRIQLLPITETSSITDEFIEQVLSTLPLNMLKKARPLLKALQKIDIQVTEDGNISYLGQNQATGSNLIELISWVLTPKSEIKTQSVPVPIDHILFENLLRQTDLPNDIFPHKKNVRNKDSQGEIANEWLSLY